MAGRIHFNPKPEKIVETLLYLATKGEFTRYQIVKFFYLADREHLRRYGRPVTFDKYVAMKNGPVASIAYDLLKQQDVCGIKCQDLPFDLVEKGAHWGIANPKRDVRTELFSKTDLKVLDSIVEEFAGCSFDELWEHTHRHEAYDKVWSNRSTNADDMAFDDFFENISNRETIVDELAFASRGM